jgi:hypothetical protein
MLQLLVNKSLAGWVRFILPPWVSFALPVTAFLR